MMETPEPLTKILERRQNYWNIVNLKQISHIAQAILLLNLNK